MRFWRLLGFVFCLSVGLHAAHAASDATIETFTLQNGLEVVVIPNHRVPAVSHMMWYKVGSADDPPGKSGLAHYLEHMMFQGTPKYPAGAYVDIIARHGGQHNAFTAYDSTTYYVNIAKEYLPVAMELEADRMRDIAPTESDFKKEQQVIIEERRARTDNNPDALLDEQMKAALFRNHPYGRPVIGWKHEMEALTRDDALAFHRRYYHPSNAILVVSGDITAAEFKPLAARYYGGIARGSTSRHWNEEPPQNVQRQVVLHHKNVKQPQWSRSYAASSLGYGKKEDALPLFVLSQILGTGTTSRLYQSLVVDQKLASATDVYYNGFSIGPANFDISLTPERGVDMAKLEQSVDEEIVKIIQQGITEDELARAKTLLKAETLYARDGLASMARIMGWIRMAGQGTDYFNRWPELIDGVTPEQIQQAAAVLFLPEHSVTGWLMPQAPKDKP